MKGKVCPTLEVWVLQDYEMAVSWYPWKGAILKKAKKFLYKMCLGELVIFPLATEMLAAFLEKWDK